MAPDPGLFRLRVSLRAVLGIGLAVTLCELAGLSLPASVTGGLAALLALFTVGDPTVRGQAGTTALLPVVGLPVLALATALHGTPTLRDASWLAVVFAGVHARRWGPRGHALGIFAFMMFFATQFLHAVPGQLPQLYAAVALSLAASSAVRFGAWCVERRTLPAVPVPLDGRGLARPATRQAFQATAACAFALVAGQLLSHDRWYWAVGTAWWIFVNTASRGETLVRGFRRVVGTVAGIGAGLLVAVPLHGAPAPTAALVAVCVFGIFYTAALSYSWMMFFVTVMAGLLYGLLGVLHPGLLGLRFAETAVGALGAALAVAFVLPITTHAVTDRWIERALHAVHGCTAAAARRLAGDAQADPAPRAGSSKHSWGAYGCPSRPSFTRSTRCANAGHGPVRSSPCSTTAPARYAVSPPSPPIRTPPTTPASRRPADGSRPRWKPWSAPCRAARWTPTTALPDTIPGPSRRSPISMAWSGHSSTWRRRCAAPGSSAPDAPSPVAVPRSVPFRWTPMPGMGQIYRPRTGWINTPAG